ncbi:MAG: hypothetical protein AB1898_13955 [Acidobacteriota bacterium]
MEKIEFLGLPNCYRLSNGEVDAIVTTDAGPRILRYGFEKQENILAELPDLVMETALGTWRPYGGHRLWHSPEQMPRTYAPDNSPIHHVIQDPYAIRLRQPVEPQTGIEKELEISLASSGTALSILHRLTNRNLWTVELAPWAITIMAGGGTTILPQEPYRSHDEVLLPARPFVLWHYTDLSDRRWTVGKKFIRLATAEAAMEPQKAGILNKQGWSAYSLNDALFVKRFPYVEGATYPDYNCNNETYTAGLFMEIETLGPLTALKPGDSVEHLERWYLFRDFETGAAETSLEASLRPLIDQAPL